LRWQPSRDRTTKSPALIINPADGKAIHEELLAAAFADEIKQAQTKYEGRTHDGLKEWGKRGRGRPLAARLRITDAGRNVLAEHSNVER